MVRIDIEKFQYKEIVMDVYFKMWAYEDEYEETDDTVLCFTCAVEEVNKGHRVDALLHPGIEAPKCERCKL